MPFKSNLLAVMRLRKDLNAQTVIAKATLNGATMGRAKGKHQAPNHR